MDAALAPPSPRATPERRPAWWRVPFLLLGFVALFAGAGAGLARLGYTMPGAIAGVAALHGPLMICGFFGVVIALERAVAIGRAWAYAAPALAGVGSVVVLFGAAPIAAWFYLGEQPRAVDRLAGRVAPPACAVHLHHCAGCGVLDCGCGRLGWRRAGAFGGAVVVGLLDPDHRRRAARVVALHAAVAACPTGVRRAARDHRAGNARLGAQAVGRARIRCRPGRSGRLAHQARHRAAYGTPQRAHALHRCVPAVGLCLAGGRRRSDGHRRCAAARHAGLRRRLACAAARLRVRHGVRPRADHLSVGAACGCALPAGVLRTAVGVAGIGAAACGG